MKIVSPKPVLNRKNFILCHPTNLSTGKNGRLTSESGLVEKKETDRQIEGKKENER